MVAMAENDPWSVTARTPSPDSSEDGSNTRTNLRSSFLRNDAQLIRELDLSGRYDTAKYTENPFTIARAAASRRKSAESDTSIKRNVAVVTKARPAEQKDTKPKRTGGPTKRSVPSDDDETVVEERPVKGEEPSVKGKGKGKAKGKGEATSKEGGAARRQPKLKGKPQTKYSGWLDAAGKPIPVKEIEAKKSAAVAEEAAPESSKKASGPTGVSKAPRATKKVGVKSKKDKPEDKVTFRKIPAGAGPGSMFPIVRGLEKQKELPIKTFKLSPLSLSDISDDYTAYRPIDIDALIGGVAETSKKEMEEQQARETASTRIVPVDQKEKPIPARGMEERAKREAIFNRINSNLSRPNIISLVSDDDSSYHSPDRAFEELTAIEQATNQTALRRLRERLDRDSSPLEVQEDRKYSVPSYSTTQPPSLVPSGPTAQTDYLRTPVHDQSFSTITHISQPEQDANTILGHWSSSSQLPYSSPLVRDSKATTMARYANLTTPQPRHYTGHGIAHVNQLEESVHRPSSVGGKHLYGGSPHSLPPDQAVDFRARQYTREQQLSPFHLRKSGARRDYNFEPAKKREWNESLNSRHDSKSPEWRTYEPEWKKRRTDARVVPNARVTPNFRLPINLLKDKPVQSREIAAPNSAQSTRASWFRPSPRNENQQAKRRNSNKTNDANPSFKTIAAETRDDLDRFHDQVLSSVGQAGHARNLMQQNQSLFNNNEPQHQDVPGDEDWKKAWIKTHGRERDPKLSKYAFEQSSSSTKTEHSRQGVGRVFDW